VEVKPGLHTIRAAGQVATPSGYGFAVGIVAPGGATLAASSFMTAPNQLMYPILAPDERFDDGVRCRSGISSLGRRISARRSPSMSSPHAGCNRNQRVYGRRGDQHRAIMTSVVSISASSFKTTSCPDHYDSAVAFRCRIIGSVRLS